MKISLNFLICSLLILLSPIVKINTNDVLNKKAKNKVTLNSKLNKKTETTIKREESKRPAKPSRPISLSKASKRPRTAAKPKPHEINTDKKANPNVNNLNNFNPYQQNKNYPNNYNYNHYANLYKPKSNSNSFSNYFSETSKNNQSSAGKAFAGFLLGFILLYSSIWLIFRNERANVVESDFIDWVKAQKFVNKNQATNLENNTEFEEKKAYIVEGY